MWWRNLMNVYWFSRALLYVFQYHCTLFETTNCLFCIQFLLQLFSTLAHGTITSIYSTQFSEVACYYSGIILYIESKIKWAIKQLSGKNSKIKMYIFALRLYCYLSCFLHCWLLCFMLGLCAQDHTSFELFFAVLGCPSNLFVSHWLTKA